MIVRTRKNGDREIRSIFGPNTAIVSRPTTGISSAGMSVTSSTAASLPAVGSARRLVCNLIGSLCIDVWQGEGADKRTVEDSWQAQLLDRPALGVSAFEWRFDIATALEQEENAYLLKVKSRGRVVELLPIPVNLVSASVDRATGRKVFDIHAAGAMQRLTTDDVLHIRGDAPGGGPFGVSRIQQHRDPLGAMLAAQRFEGAYFRNNARPDLAVIFPQGVTREQASQWRDEWESRYQGSDNAGKVVPLGGGATIQPIPVSLQDSQFIETRQLSIADVGRIIDVHPVLLGGEPPQGSTVKECLDFFLHLQFLPRLRRIEGAFVADPDFGFAEDGLRPCFEVPDTIFADAATRSQIMHEMIQDGRLLVDEARAEEGRPPLPPVPSDWTQAPGQVPQITPVGGAKNPAAATTSTSADPTADGGQRSSVTVPAIELHVDQDMQPLAAQQRSFGEAFLKLMEGMVRSQFEREAVREARDAARDRQQDELAAAHARALEAVGQPNIVVNVEPTPITVEVPVQPVQLTLEMPEQPEPAKTVSFQRDPNGRIVGATVTEEHDG